MGPEPTHCADQTRTNPIAAVRRSPERAPTDVGLAEKLVVRCLLNELLHLVRDTDGT